MSGKWFTDSAESAAQYDQMIYGRLSEIVSIRVPGSFAQGLHTDTALDGVMAVSRYAPEELVGALNDFLWRVVDR